MKTGATSSFFFIFFDEPSRLIPQKAQVLAPRFSIHCTEKKRSPPKVTKNKTKKTQIRNIFIGATPCVCSGHRQGREHRQPKDPKT